ncbi:MAG: hypothetical protein H6985_14320 [Pseudomonadales bacterium]|nr:hypothetical protein [Pseudomonadales bacterium]
MRLSYFVGASLGAILISAASQAATLIGDEVEFKGCYPTSDACTATTNYLVGSSDNYIYGVSSTSIEASSVNVTLLGGPAPATFNGIVISDIDWVGEPNLVIKGATLQNNTSVGIGPEDISFDDHTLWINVEGAGPGNFTVQLTTVPIPGAVWLFGSALLSLVGLKRRRG